MNKYHRHANHGRCDHSHLLALLVLLVLWTNPNRTKKDELGESNKTRNHVSCIMHDFIPPQKNIRGYMFSCLKWRNPIRTNCVNVLPGCYNRPDSLNASQRHQNPPPSPRRLVIRKYTPKCLKARIRVGGDTKVIYPGFLRYPSPARRVRSKPWIKLETRSNTSRESSTNSCGHLTPPAVQQSSSLSNFRRLYSHITW